MIAKTSLRELGLPKLLAKPHSLAHFGRSLPQNSLIETRANAHIGKSYGMTILHLHSLKWNTKPQRVSKWEKTFLGGPSTYPSTSLQVPYWLPSGQKVNELNE